MAVMEFDAATLAQMQKQAGGVPAPEVEDDTAPATDTTTEPGVKQEVHEQDTASQDTTPDIDLVDPKVIAEKEAAEEKAAADAAKAEEDAKKAAEEKAKDLEESARVNKTLTDAGVDPIEAEARLIREGGLTPEHIADLKAKVDPRLVDAYVERFNTRLEKARAEAASKADPAPVTVDDTAVKKMNKFIFDSVGGKDKFTAMAGIIKANATSDVVDAINAKLRSDNRTVVQEGLSEAVAQYKKLTGRSTTSMTGEPAGNQNEAFVFMTKDDFQATMRTEKYRTDPQYAAKIDAQRMKSRKLDEAAVLPGQYRNVRNGRMYNV